MTFDDIFAYVVGVEGKLSLDPQDRGNWTGGKVGVGELKGTKYGISAASYPLLDIANLSLSDAKAIGRRDFWDKLSGDSLPWGTALLLYDFGYNAGISEAARVAQHALGLTVDGVLGAKTLAALQVALPQFAFAFTAWRIMAYTQMAGWPHEGAGWTVRALTTFAKATS